MKDDTKQWCMSVSPSNGTLGTAADVDFCSAQASGDLPPPCGWTMEECGKRPSPTLISRPKKAEKVPAKTEAAVNLAKATADKNATKKETVEADSNYDMQATKEKEKAEKLAEAEAAAETEAAENLAEATADKDAEVRSG